MRTDIYTKVVCLALSFLFLFNDAMAAVIHRYANNAFFYSQVTTSSSSTDWRVRNQNDEKNSTDFPVERRNSGQSLERPDLSFGALGSKGVIVGASELDPLNNPNDDFLEFGNLMPGQRSRAFLRIEIPSATQDETVNLTINESTSLKIDLASQWRSDGTYIIPIDQDWLRETSNWIFFSQTAPNAKPQFIHQSKLVFSDRNIANTSTVLVQLREASEDEFSTDDPSQLSALALRFDQSLAIPKSIINVNKHSHTYRSLSLSNNNTPTRIRIKVKELEPSKFAETSLFYFDKREKAWLRAANLERSFEEQTLNGDVPSGADYFAGMIQTPEMPEASAYMPTAISDLEPANPATGVMMIQPPSPNQQGDASVQFPFNIPVGRQGMTPSVALSYNSSSPTGWCGVGWNVSTSSIAVSTKWGVPTFSASLESEVYTLDGQELHGEEGVKANRPKVQGGVAIYASRESADSSFFFPRVVQGYRTIRRKRIGATEDTKNYVWIVKNGDGSKSYYGTRDGSTVEPTAVVRTTSGHITKWMLARKVDKWGNYIDYNYSQSVIPPTQQKDIKEGGLRVKLDDIQYTGNLDPVTAPRYQVKFITSSNRIDATVASNTGRKIVDDLRLDQVQVNYYNGTSYQEVRTYQLYYSNGDFQKSLLDSVAEKVGGQRFYSHKFEYHSSPNIAFQAQPELIEIDNLANTIIKSLPEGMEPLTKPLSSLIMPSPIKTTTTSGYSVGGSVGAGFDLAILPDKTFTFSGNIGFSENGSKDKVQMQDANGDGIPDLIYDRPDRKYYYPITLNENGELVVGNKVNIDNVDLIVSDATSLNVGYNFVTPFNAFYFGQNWNTSNSVTSSYLLDYNKDGILDYVSPNGDNSKVNFGVLSKFGDLSFEANSANTLAPIIRGVELDQDEPDIPTKPFQIAKIWRAPKDGTVDVIGMAELLEGFNGVAEVALQHNNDLIPTATTGVDWNLVQPGPPVQMDYGNIGVRKGDYLIFRYIYEQNGQQDVLNWDPRVVYNDGDLLDGNLTNFANTSYTEGFLLSRADPIHFYSNDEVEVVLNRLAPSAPLSDDLYYRIKLLISNTGTKTTRTYHNKLAAGSTSFSGTFTTNTGQSAPFIDNFFQVPGLNEGDSIIMLFELWSTSHVDWDRISWRPEVRIKANCVDLTPTRYPTVEYHTYNRIYSMAGTTSAPGLNHGELFYPDVQVQVDKNAIHSIFSASSSNHTSDVFVTLKREGQVVSQKALRFYRNAGNSNLNNITQHDLNSYGEVNSTSLGGGQYIPSNSNFDGSELSETDFYFEIHTTGMFSEQIAQYIASNLQFLTFYGDQGSQVFFIPGENLNTNIYYRLLDQFLTHNKNWGQFAWSPNEGEEKLALRVEDLIVPSTQLANSENDFSQSEPSQSFFDQNQALLNPWEHNFIMLDAIRGERKHGLRKYLVDDDRLSQSPERLDRYTAMGTYLGVYGYDGLTHPGVLGEPESKSSTPTPTPYDIYSAYGASSLNKSYTSALSTGAGPLNTSQSTGSYSRYFSQPQQFLADLNGDGFPDLVKNKSNTVVQLTNPSGSFQAATEFSTTPISKSITNNSGATANGSFINEDLRFAKLGASLTASTSLGTNLSGLSYQDINGDNLPDRLDLVSGSPKIELNNGGGFDGYYVPVGSGVYTTKSKNNTFALGANASGISALSDNNEVLALSFSGGVNINSVGSKSELLYIDLNGDGLSDILNIYGSQPEVYLNTGTAFSRITLTNTPSIENPNDFGDQINKSQAYGISGSGSGSFSFPLGVAIKMTVSINGGGSYSVNKLRTSFMDMNADGVVDFVHAKDNGDLEVYYSIIQKSNLLKTIKNPMGGITTIDYELEGSKVGVFEPQVHTHRSLKGVGERIIWDMPMQKWVMSQIGIYDGVDLNDGTSDLDGTDTHVKYFSYDGGLKSRRERDFLGFTRVETRYENARFYEFSNSQSIPPEEWITEVSEYIRPYSHSLSDRIKEEVTTSLLKYKYKFLNSIIETGNEQNATYHKEVRLISRQMVNYNFFQLGTGFSGENMHQLNVDAQSELQPFVWATAKGTESVFPAVSTVSTLSFPQLREPEKSLSTKFDFFYDRFMNVIRVEDFGAGQSNSVDSVLIGQIEDSRYVYRTQQNSCGSLIEDPELSDEYFSVYVVASTVPDFEDDIIYIPKTSSCLGIGNGPYRQPFCAGGEYDTFYSTHRKQVTDIIDVYETRPNTTYSGSRIVVFTYHNETEAPGITNLMKSQEIYLNSTAPANLKRKSEVTALQQNRAPSTLSTKLNATENAVFDIAYNGYGNVTQITGPSNHKPQRLITNFTYDGDVHQFVTNISNLYGDDYCSIYDPATGQLQKTSDANGHPTQFGYDQFHRLQYIWGPKEIYDATRGPSVQYAYFLRASDPSYAITYHNTASSSASVVTSPQTSACQSITDMASNKSFTSSTRTYTFTDGIGEAVQVKTEKSKAVGQGSGATHVSSFLVSGIVEKDRFGKQVTVRQAFLDPNSNPAIISEVASDAIQFSFQYDYDLRETQHSAKVTGDNIGTGTGPEVTETVIPTISYEWANVQGNDLFGTNQSINYTITGYSQGTSTTSSYVDARGRTLATAQTGSGQSWTYFNYNDLDDLISSVNPLGQTTSYTYDLAGRMISETHPDRGLTSLTYDPAGNLIKKETPATGSTGITMSYNYNRLESKTYPHQTNNDLYNVSYTYGGKNDGKNGATRVVSIIQGQDFKTDLFGYDEMGNVVEEDISIDVPNIGNRTFVTQYSYDTFGRILKSIYPDGDEVTYYYTPLGELSRITSDLPSHPGEQEIIEKINYDGFGNISYMLHGNGVESSFNYGDITQTLLQSKVDAFAQGSTSLSNFIKREYSYEKRGNIREVAKYVNNELLGGTAGGANNESTMEFTYEYDGHNRLSNARFYSESSTQESYELNMTYNAAGGITQKSSITKSKLYSPMLDPAAVGLDYILTYNYNSSKPHQLSTVTEITEPTLIYGYNNVGSIDSIASDDGTTVTLVEDFYWNDDQSLIGVKNAGGVHHYVYDYKGERIMKSSFTSSTTIQNDEDIDNFAYLSPYTVYVNPYYVITAFSGGDEVSKHYYMGMQRVATDRGISTVPDPSGPGEPGPGPGGEMSTSGSAGNSLAGALTDGMESPLPSGGNSQNSAVLDDLSRILEEFKWREGVDYQKKDLEAEHKLADFYEPNSMGNGTGAAEAAGPGGGGSGTYYHHVRYWYHPDYLGNVDMVTDRNGEAYQFFLYTPWGENMYSYRRTGTGFSSPYRFNGKELDPETGNYYYGARYYDPKTSLWLSVDPMAELYPNKTPFNFSGNNPINIIDPNGMWEQNAEGDWVAEKGDSWWSFHKQTGMSWSDTKKFAKDYNAARGVDNWESVFVGDVVSGSASGQGLGYSYSTGEGFKGDISNQTNNSSWGAVPESDVAKLVDEATHSPAGQFVSNVISITETFSGREGFVGPLLDGASILSDAASTDWRIPMEVGDFIENTVQLGVENLFGPVAPAANVIIEDSKDPNGLTNLNNGRSAETYKANKNNMDAYTRILMYQNGTDKSQRKR